MENEKNSIKEIQEKLRNITVQANDQFSIVPSGIYDEETKKAVAGFQRQFGDRFGLNVTGEVDSDTWHAICEVNAEITEMFGSPVPLCLFPLPDKRSARMIEKDDTETLDMSECFFCLHEGDSGPFVNIIQSIFNILAHQYSNFTATDDTDTYSGICRENVLALQKISGLEKTGELDTLTWNALARLFNILDDSQKTYGCSR